MPRTLSFREVLCTKKYETAFYVSDTSIDDLAMFRYELNTVFNQHKYEDEPDSELFMGPNPLSKVEGKQIRNLDEETKRRQIDLYRPPGLIRCVDNSKYVNSIQSAKKNDLKRTIMDKGAIDSDIPAWIEPGNEESDKL